MRALLFDLDDTLYPRDAYVQSGFAAVADHVAARYSCSSAAALATLRHAHANGDCGREFQALCRAYQIDGGVVPTLIDVFRHHDPSIVLSDGVRAMLRRARDDGWRIGIVTNGAPAVQRRKVNALGLTALTDCVVYAEECVAGGKPHPDVIYEALRTLSAEPAHAVMAGDDPARDTLGARLAGVYAIEVTAHRHVFDRTILKGVLRPHATVASAVDVPAMAAFLLEESVRAV